MAELQVATPGSAEWTSGHLNGRGLGCSHVSKYRVDDSQNQAWYPSRLGFFHAINTETRVSFLDTNKLCKGCLDLVVPSGFLYWSMFTSLKPSTDTSNGNPLEPAKRWLDATQPSETYLRLFQSGTEDFPQVPSLSRNIAPHLITPPTVIYIPKATGA